MHWLFGLEFDPNISVAVLGSSFVLDFFSSFGKNKDAITTVFVDLGELDKL